MNHIAILDFGSQYTHLIARRVRELGVLSKIYAPDIKAAKLPADAVGLILSGGPQSVYAKDSLTIDQKIIKLGKPILGLCYGHQLLANLLGGAVAPGSVREYGRAQLEIKKDSPLLAGVNKKSLVWMSHGDTVTKLAPGFSVIAATADCPIAAASDEARAIFGLQFHPEVRHTSAGKKILKNFVINICRAERKWKIENLLNDLIEKIRQQAGAKNVFLLVSGGVDSTVCFALLEKALGRERVYGLHIDTGFMRQNESRQVKASLAAAGYNNLRQIDASALFYKRLRNVFDPEQKRQIIGQTFLDVQEQTSQKLKLDVKKWLLGQGTIYPDTIESGGTRHADKIKTHHNRVDAIREMISQGRVIEPLADFYKDEVRQLGQILGLPAELINRHPFPGPGLAIRVLWHCERSEASQKLATLWAAIPTLNSGIAEPVPSIPEGVVSTLSRNDIFYSILPIKSVGVQGDNRTYAHPLVLWFNNLSMTGLSAEALAKAEGETSWNKLDQLASQITNTNRHINRVLLLLNPSSDNKIKGQLKMAYLTPKRVELARQIDALALEEITNAGQYDKIWQFPVVLLPFGEKGKESIVLRPIVSQEAMTANFARLPQVVLTQIVERILATEKISYVFYDITNKPPGTIEWE